MINAGRKPCFELYFSRLKMAAFAPKESTFGNLKGSVVVITGKQKEMSLSGTDE